MFGVCRNHNFCVIMKLIHYMPELIEMKFPWYLCMHQLMGTSPIIDWAAIAHSQTPVDLSTLGCHSQSSAPSLSDDDSIPINWPPSPAPSDRGDKSDKEDDNNDDDDSTAWSSPSLSFSPPWPLATPTPKAKIELPTSIPHTNKHKAIADKVQKIANTDCSQHMKIAKIKEQEKTSRSQAKYQSKHALEMAHMEFQHHEAESACQHQLLILEKQVELECLRLHGHGHGLRHAHFSNVVSAPAPGPSSGSMFNFNPSPSGPMFGIDPLLN